MFIDTYEVLQSLIDEYGQKDKYLTEYLRETWTLIKPKTELGLQPIEEMHEFEKCPDEQIISCPNGILGGGILNKKTKSAKRQRRKTRKISPKY